MYIYMDTLGGPYKWHTKSNVQDFRKYLIERERDETNAEGLCSARSRFATSRLSDWSIRSRTLNFQVFFLSFFFRDWCRESQKGNTVSVSGLFVYVKGFGTLESLNLFSCVDHSLILCLSGNSVKTRNLRSKSWIFRENRFSRSKMWIMKRKHQFREMKTWFPYVRTPQFETSKYYTLS